MPDGFSAIRPEWLLNGAPFEVQLVSVERARFQRGYNWWLEQGLGKTAVMLQNWLEFRHRVGGPRAPRLIIITLNSMRLTWRDQIREWVKEDLDIEVWPEAAHKNPDVFICNYESFAGQGEGWGRAFDRAMFLVQQVPSMLGVDEAHRIKTPGSRWSKSVLELAKECVARRGLTGTPWGQSVMDLFPALKLANKLDGVNQFVFKGRYAKKGGYMGKQIVGVNESRRAELDELIDSCSFRALKSQWTDLPPKMPPVTIRLDLAKELVGPYRSMLADFLVEIESRAEDDPIVAKMVVTQMGKLQQISSGFIYDEMKNIHTLLPLKKLPKFEALMDLIEGLDGKSKMIVFCHFKPTARALVDAINEKTPDRCCFMRGTPEEIEAEKAKFNQDGGAQVLVTQISVGAAGHTLLGGPNVPCYTTAFFENNFVLIDREQSMDRNHRFGQKSAVSYYDFASTAIELHVIKALQTKKALASAVIDHRGPIQKEFNL